VTVGTSDEFDRVRSVLEERGVNGSADFGYFVNRPDLFRPSEFDERSAMPVLLELLPTLADGSVVAATARHLRRPWARPTAFVPLTEAFRRWAAGPHPDAGWALGDAVASAARPNDSEVLLSLATNPAYGTARQMIVYSLWRFRTDERVVEALPTLAGDPDVSVQALSALRRAIGNEAALPVIRELSASSPHKKVREQAARELRKPERARRR
jgi:HEAT repeat protein